jgi:uncharacterized protein (DUF1778 family)
MKKKIDPIPTRKKSTTVREAQAAFAVQPVGGKEKEARIEIRVDRSSKELIEKAAALLGQTLSSFVVSRMVRDAREIIDAHHRTEVSLADWERFYDILSNPKPPNAALKRAAKRYGKIVTQSEGL